ncbi:39S ribosomal protein L53, mitochondrial isoform X1 [Micropterus dolomieu]|uniref:39S ribosomal protein L53, mitochondrial isoform X1 n=1 Tax=Micropterus dolomieu TaxID=147949 RepID=UPI001E8E3E0B|nr:39S ribosomal protein L53, mitochondrial isoform X1 [Micropterus dolomieu]
MAAPSKKATVVLKAVKRIAIQFSPFESNVRSTRENSKSCGKLSPAWTRPRLLLIISLTLQQQQWYLYMISSTGEFLAKVGSEKARATNMNCEVISVVKHDKSEPVVDITYLDGERLVMKGAKLTSSEMLSAFQSRCTAKDLQAKLAAKK